VSSPELNADIRTEYVSIAREAIDRACGAYELYGPFPSIQFAEDKLLEEFTELRFEIDRLSSKDLSDMEKQEIWQRIKDEAIDVATVAIRIAHLAEKNL
jgi:hypothetical protein